MSLIDRVKSMYDFPTSHLFFLHRRIWAEMHYIIPASLCLLLNKLAVHERPRSFKKNVTVFKTKRGDVLKKRREIFGVGRKWGGATSTTTSFALIFSDLGAWCWICRWFWQISWNTTMIRFFSPQPIQHSKKSPTFVNVSHK